MENGMEFFQGGMASLLQHSLVQRLVLALVVLGLAKLLLFLLKHILAKAVVRGMDASAKPLVYSLFSYAIYVVTLLLVLHIAGVNTAGLVALVGAASLAVGLALKDALANIASGLLLMFLRPFKAGDYIECGQVKGRIKGIGLFNTTLVSLDGLYISAPNSSLWGSPIVNFSKNATRRLEISVGIDYGDSTDAALGILRDLVENEPRFLKEPAPQFFVAALSDSAVNVSFRAWARNSDYFDLLWTYTDEVKRRFDAAGITIPFPQRTVHMVQDVQEK
ncbi:mechanosensitive ion channel family protein [uncultured Fibrobacter sp.]|uniref:mechanosensitive ion channel family protein n=1 Tax=uncultured Fibrobacter sp. TaxID=261512 RepID=UPI0025CD8175|nr:mechanosensitive ion channel family protein [uncultured Fibrobacter sp.]